MIGYEAVDFDDNDENDDDDDLKQGWAMMTDEDDKNDDNDVDNEDLKSG